MTHITFTVIDINDLCASNNRSTLESCFLVRNVDAALIHHQSQMEFAIDIGFSALPPLLMITGKNIGNIIRAFIGISSSNFLIIYLFI